MSRLLTSRQADELHKSIIAYLSANNLSDAAAALRAELGLGHDIFDAATATKYETLLEKKWTSIMMDLELRNAALQSELDNATPTSLSRRNQDPTSWLPRSPPRHSLESHRESINCVAFHPVFSSVASGSDDCTIKVWDWELGELEKTIKGHTRAVQDVDYGGPRGGILLASCSSDLTIKLWDPADDYKNIRNLHGHDHSVSCVRFIPSGAAGAPSSGNLLVSASRDTSLRIWDVTTGYCVKTLQGHTGWVRAVCPTLDGRFLISTGDDKTARLWDISAPNSECKQTMVGHEHYNECCALAPPTSYQYLAPLAGLKKPPPTSSTAEFMATGSRDKTIKVWDARGTCLLTLAGHDNWVRAVLFHPGGKYILSVSDDKTLRCWDLSQAGKCVKVLSDAHEHFITCLEWAPGIAKDMPVENSGSSEAQNGKSNGTPKTNRAGAIIPDAQIRCVIATGGVDMKLRIFAN
ncbi:probable Nuclear distribution protein PAC1 [Rhynchosporium secalis]|uniref:Nuclear distribution protein PAC1 n=1 Tax=Rhynchosporium secalis TaxID=38038 RepID=A0A1E1MK29_RHYSE|nr:probable Nuclear distribution protein PAC1 [Rhynchosporium secalis]